jgi:hypothetical protein
MRGVFGLAHGIALRRARAVVVASLPFAMGCTGPQTQSNEEWAQWEAEWIAPSPVAELFVLVVDDAPSGQAELLRERVASGVVRSLAPVDAELPSIDPAAWRPVDWTVIVVLPSGSGSDRWVGPASVPAWAHQVTLAGPQVKLAAPR